MPRRQAVRPKPEPIIWGPPHITPFLDDEAAIVVEALFGDPDALDGTGRDGREIDVDQHARRPRIGEQRADDLCAPGCRAFEGFIFALLWPECLAERD